MPSKVDVQIKTDHTTSNIGSTNELLSNCDLIVQMTTSQRTSMVNPKNKLTIFDSQTNSYWLFKDGVWHEIASALNMQEDESNSMAIHIPETEDAPIIAITLTQGDGNAKTFYEAVHHH
jgi:hypothetical protein